MRLIDDDMACKLCMQSSHILAEAGINLRNFVKSVTLVQQIEQHESNLLVIEKGRTNKILRIKT